MGRGINKNLGLSSGIAIIIIALLSLIVIAGCYDGMLDDIQQKIDEDRIEAGTAPTYSVTYDGNGSDGGTVPVDSNAYVEGATVIAASAGTMTRTGYIFIGWNTASDGSGTARAANDFFTMGASNITLYAKWTALRCTGPAGGLIFYDKGNYSDGWRYLESAPVSTQWFQKEWGSYGTLIGGTGTEIGDGIDNTTIVATWLDNNSETDRAAQLCRDLTEGGYSDWFLPSKDELNQMYVELHLHSVGDFDPIYYPSSSEYDANGAWIHNFNNGNQGYGNKQFYTNRVRAARAF